MGPKQRKEGVVPAAGKKLHQQQHQHQHQQPKAKNPGSTSSQLNTVDPPNASVGGAVTAPKPLNYDKKRKLKTKRVIETRAQAPEVDAPIVAQPAENLEIGNEDALATAESAENAEIDNKDESIAFPPSTATSTAQPTPHSTFYDISTTGPELIGLLKFLLSTPGAAHAYSVTDGVDHWYVTEVVRQYRAIMEEC